MGDINKQFFGSKIKIGDTLFFREGVKTRLPRRLKTLEELSGGIVFSKKSPLIDIRKSIPKVRARLDVLKETQFLQIKKGRINIDTRDILLKQAKRLKVSESGIFVDTGVTQRFGKIERNIALRSSIKRLAQQQKLLSLGLKPDKQFGLIGKAPKKLISDRKVLKALKQIRKESLKKTGGASLVFEQVGAKELRELSLQKFKAGQPSIKVKDVPPSKFIPKISVSKITRKPRPVLSVGAQQKTQQIFWGRTQQIQILKPPKEIINIDVSRNFPGFTQPVPGFGTPTGIPLFGSLGKLNNFGQVSGRIPEVKFKGQQQSALLQIPRGKGKTKQRRKTETRIISLPKTRTIARTIQESEQQQRQRSRQGIGLLTKQLQIKKTKETPIPFLLFKLGRVKERKIPKQRGWLAEGLRKSTKPKQRKWVRLNRVPYKRKTSARDRGAFAVDNSLSARFRVRPVRTNRTRTPQNVGYFNQNKSKFRDFKIVKGRKVKLNNKYIEKRPFRLDTPGEKKKIRLAKFVAPKLKSPSSKKKKRKRNDIFDLF